ncbi:MAG: sugar phosphate isomerase/epimerase family protein [Candidatus Latescibacterota bacterium]
MSHSFSRRQFLAAGTSLAAGAAFTLSPAYARPPVSWDKSKRDLTPGNTPVRLANFSLQANPSQKESVTETIRKIRDAGYSSTLTHTSLGTKNPWLTVPDSVVTELREALKTYDVTLFDAMIWANLIHRDEKTRQEALSYAAENVTAADRIGCPMVTAVTGSCDPNYYIGIHPDNWSKETWKRSVESIRQILRDTSGCKTSLGIEACITTNMDSPKSQKRIMEDVGDPRCKICLDPTNMMSFERYYHSTELLNECFDLLGENILGCHAKDTYIVPDKMLAYITEVPPGKGVQDYETYLVLLSRMKWPRTLLIEHIQQDEYAPAKAFIEETAKKVGVKIQG